MNYNLFGGICQINIENLPKIRYNKGEGLRKSKAVIIMKNLKINKILAVFICAMVLVISLGSTVAWASDPITDAEDLLTRPGNNEVGITLKKIADLLVGIAFALSILKLTQIGFQFMLGAGKKSKAKESLIPWFVGVLICATYLFLGPWFMNIMNSTNILGGGPFDIKI